MDGTFRLCLLFMLIFHSCAQNSDGKHFVFNGFRGANLTLDGLAEIRANGLVQLTNTSKQQSGHLFYPEPIRLDQYSSFSTCFVFAMNPDVPNHGGHGIAFVISDSTDFSDAVPAEYLGLFNLSNNGQSSNHVFAVELDTIQNAVFGDIDGNHLGIDVNGLTSISAASAAYYSDGDKRDVSLDLTSKKAMQVWVDYDQNEPMISVSIAPVEMPKPSRSLLSARVNLSGVVYGRSVFVGFSSSTGLTANEHYLLGWSWNQTGPARSLDSSTLPQLPKFGSRRSNVKPLPTVLATVLSVLIVVVVTVLVFIRRRKYREVQEEWEQEFTNHRFAYKDLHSATRGFRDSELLGSGGFGKVYRGTLPDHGTQIAVKKISHDSKQGMQEFVSEIISMRRLRHRNLVQLLGYCRRKGELLLVYDYMPNGSLDKFLFKTTQSLLPWSHRFSICKGVASALLYLHEEWEQVVLHRDIKASNVLLDSQMNPRLGDFGLARLHDHGTNPRSTRVVGTVGYLAPELSHTGKPTTSTDVYAFGIFVLEVSCGRRPFSPLDADDFILVDWVFDCWKKGTIMDASDPKLQGQYVPKEMELVLKLGLLCTHCKPESRPTMRQVVQILRGEATLPEIPEDYDNTKIDLFTESWGTSSSFPSTFGVSQGKFFSVDSVLHRGR